MVLAVSPCCTARAPKAPCAGPLVLNQEVVEYGTKAVENVLHTLGMRPLLRFWLSPKPVYYDSTGIRADQAGILFSNVELGDKVDKGDVLAEVETLAKEAK